MNDPKLEALERMTQANSRKGDLTVALAMNLALILRNAKIIADEEYEHLKRQRERIDAA